MTFTPEEEENILKKLSLNSKLKKKYLYLDI